MNQEDFKAQKLNTINKEMTDMNSIICELVINARYISHQRVLSMQSSRNIGSNKVQRLEKIISQDFDFFFNGEDLYEKITLEEYLERILQIKELQGPIFIQAGLLFYRIIMTPHIYHNFEDSQYSIKLFGTCLYICQKMHMDIGFFPKDIGKLLGLKPKSLNQKELFLFQKIFKFDLRLNEKSYKRFIRLLKALPYKISNLKHTFNLIKH